MNQKNRKQSLPFQVVFIYYGTNGWKWYLKTCRQEHEGFQSHYKDVVVIGRTDIGGYIASDMGERGEEYK